jgi:DNA-binding GntR family transcriptional regulator
MQVSHHATVYSSIQARGVNAPLTEDRGERGSRVYQEVLARIRSGAVSLDDRLVDTTLAAEFGLSRMPAREALLRLAHEGYLVGSTRGFRLPRLTTRDMADIFEVRRLLEPRAAASAAAVISDSALDALEAALDAARAAVAQADAAAFAEANGQFRRAWMAATPNRRLASTIARFVDHVQLVRRNTLHDPNSRAVNLALLEDLMLGFRRRDALAVQDAMARFVDRAQDVFLALHAREPDA